MKILIDFTAIKSGGGVQLASNFIDFINENSFEGVSISFLVSDKFPLINKIKNRNRVYTFSSNYLVRLVLDNYYINKLIKEECCDVVYTFFGSGFGKLSSAKNIINVAYPIICYDDSCYWNNIPKYEFIKKKVFNFVRRYRLKKADCLIFETEIMKDRCIKSLGYSGDSYVIAPAPTSYIQKSTVEKYDIFTFLALTSLDFHKNIWRIPSILKRCYQNNIIFKIAISCEKEEFLRKYNKIINVDFYLIDLYFDFIGLVRPENISYFYNRAHCVLNLSDLESFSNNYMEAWISRLPILCSDRDFSRYICKGSAIYTEPHCSNKLYESFVKVVAGEFDANLLKKAGIENLNNLLDSKKRFDSLLGVILK